MRDEYDGICRVSLPNSFKTVHVIALQELAVSDRDANALSQARLQRRLKALWAVAGIPTGHRAKGMNDFEIQLYIQGAETALSPT